MWSSRPDIPPALFSTPNVKCVRIINLHSGQRPEFVTETQGNKSTWKFWQDTMKISGTPFIGESWNCTFASSGRILRWWWDLFETVWWKYVIGNIYIAMYSKFVLCIWPIWGAVASCLGTRWRSSLVHLVDIMPGMHVFDCRRKQSTWRKPTQTWGEHTNSTHWTKDLLAVGQLC